MRRPGSTWSRVGIFSWAWLEPAPGAYELRLARRGAGPACRRPASWSTSPPRRPRRRRGSPHRHPETLPVTGTARSSGPAAGRPTARARRSSATGPPRLVERLAPRYRDHPALAMWHVGNEYGCHVTCCWCDTSATAFRAWLLARYGDLDALNAAWGTAFWSQRYTDWEQVQPPRATPTFANPGQRLDFRRFSSDEHLACFVAERDVLHRITPGVPVTTNFMAHKDVVDYWAWADEVDVVSDDHYLTAADPARHVDLAFEADTTRGLSRGRPWLLMEHSTSAVNWQPRNVPKRPGETIRNSLQHVARGADGAMFFQWRQSRAGAEKCHSAMVPHAGPDSRLFREVTELGGILDRLAPVAGSTVTSDVALVFAGSRGGPSRPTPTERRPALPRGRARPARRTVRAGHHRRRGAARRGSRRLPAGPGTDPAPAERRRRGVAGGATSAAAATCSSRSSRASSTSTTTSGSAATPAPSATCSACGSRSSSRCPE